MTMKKSSPHLIAPAAAARVRARVVAIVEALPEGSFVPTGAHGSLQAHGKRFGWYMDDHHGDGRVVVECKGDHLTNSAQIATDPSHFYVPKYGGHRGWIGYALDVAGVDWKVVTALLGDASRKGAPKRTPTGAPKRTPKRASVSLTTKPRNAGK
ncbi:MAG: hypothetical protein ABIT38_17155 [Gemmatimonadaceae bacterium]